VTFIRVCVKLYSVQSIRPKLYVRVGSRSQNFQCGGEGVEVGSAGRRDVASLVRALKFNVVFVHVAAFLQEQWTEN